MCCRQNCFKVLYLRVFGLLLLIQTGSTGPTFSFSTGGDMLDFLVQTGEISERDGLMATWFHRANNKEDMNTALASKLTHMHVHTQANIAFLFDSMICLRHRHQSELI